MQQAIEFENELARKYPANQEEEQKVQQTPKDQVQYKDGKVTVEASGTAEDIRKKYAPKEKDTDEINADVFQKI